MTHISQVNSHIEDYLDYYTNLPESPKFAILLKGKWGSGKSWFINKYIDKKTKIKPLYVSLYGVNSFSQIEDSLLEQISPFWNSKGMKIAEKVGKGLLKGTLKIDLDGDNQDDGNWSFSMPDIEKKFLINDSDFSLLIFDDLERCSLEIENILGYINTFVESQDLKVIIIANEEELEKKYEENKKNELNKYRRVKEKLIGKTLEIFADPESALKDFIEFVESKHLKQFLQHNNTYKLIEELYQIGNHKNLRTLQQIILDFERIFNKLPPSVQECEELLTDTLKILTIFSIEISSANLKIEYISKINDMLEINELSKIKPKSDQTTEGITEDEKKAKKMAKTFEKYYVVNNLLFMTGRINFVLNLEWWQDFFDKGIVEEKELNNFVYHTRYFPDSNIPEWFKLDELINGNYGDMSDEEFEKLLNDVESKYKRREYENLTVIRCLTYLFLVLEDRGLYPKSKRNIIDDAKQYIDELIKSDKFDYNDIFNNKVFINSINYIRIDFYGREITEFQEFNDYIQNCVEKIRQEKAPQEAKELLTIMRDDVDEFDLIINFCYFNLSLKAQQLGNDQIKRPEKSYSDFPIFAYVNAQYFMNSFLDLPQTQRLNIVYSLKKRSEKLSEDQTKQLSKELDFLNKVKTILENEINQRKGKFSGYSLRSILLVFNSLIYSDISQKS